MVDLKEAFGPWPMSVVAIVLSTISLCLHAIKQKDDEPEQPIADDPDLPQNPNIYGIYDRDKCQHEKVKSIVIDKNGLVQALYADPSIGLKKIWCETMIEFCWADCPKFKRAMKKDLTGAVFSCDYHPCIYEGETLVESKRSKKK
jgi:hypothetical protein